MDYVDTFYRRSLRDERRRPSLQGREEADVCVVGGGLAGITAALALARHGKRVVVLEAARVGWGASGRNGGFVSPGYAAGSDAIARRAGRSARRHCTACPLKVCALSATRSTP
jgi:glycine/D-amino acid oxidase-like deaminating enzyme